MNFYRFFGIVLFIGWSSLVTAQNNRMNDFYTMNDMRISRIMAQRSEMNVPEDFQEMLAKNREMIADNNLPLERKILYQQRLIRFLESTENADLFAKGRYTEVLRYNLFLIKWTELKQLQQNIMHYPLLSIRALPLFADEQSAVSLLLDSFAVIYPDDVLRSAGYINPSVMDKVLSKVVYVAPETAKKYFMAGGAVANQIKSSSDPVLIAMRDIYNAGAARTRAYYLLDGVLKKQYTAQQADSLVTDKERFFKLLTEMLAVQNVAGIYSINQELEYMAIDITRSLGMKSGGSSISYSQVMNYDTKQLFSLLVFGHKELFPIDITSIENMIIRKQNEVPLTFFRNMPKQAVSDLVKKMQREEKLESFLQMAGEKNRAYLITLLSYEQPNYNRQPTNIEDARFSHPKPTVTEPKKDEPKKNKDEPKKTEPEEMVVQHIEQEEYVEPVRFEFTDEEKRVMQLKQNIFKTLQNIPSFLNEPYAKEVLLYAAQVEPNELLQKSNEIISKFFFTEVMEKAALNAPVSVKRYLGSPSHAITMMLSKSTNPYIQKMFEINEITKFQTKPYLLINELADEQMPIEKVLKICEDQQSLFKKLVRMVSRKNYIGRYSIEKEFSYFALRFIREINDKIGQPESSRFASLEGFSNDELYFITVYGREEVFTSTFSGIFTRYKATLPAMNEHEFNRFMNLPKLRTFIAICAANGKFGELLSHFSEEQKEELLQRFVGGLDTEENTFEETIMISETIANIDDISILLPIQQNIKKTYLRCDSTRNSRCMATYGLLAGLCKDKVVYDAKWYKAMAKKYQAADLTTLRFKSVDVRNLIVEQMFFYDDEDGRDSYNNFVSLFRNSAHWKIDEYFSYVKVYSVSGKRIEIYANKPSYVESGNQSIQRLFAENNYAPSIIIHRGHSFHTESTLEKVPESAKFIFIGSCGGFYKASLASQNAPGAHIIATRQIGTKQINDPLIFAVNEAFREGKDIDWPIFWDKMKTSLGNYSLFHDYVPPHKNIESVFHQAYYKTLGL